MNMKGKSESMMTELKSDISILLIKVTRLNPPNKRKGLSIVDSVWLVPLGKWTGLPINEGGLLED